METVRQLRDWEKQATVSSVAFLVCTKTVSSYTCMHTQRQRQRWRQTETLTARTDGGVSHWTVLVVFWLFPQSCFLFTW